MAFSMMYRYDMRPLMNKIADDLAASQHADGAIPTIAPEYTLFDAGSGFEDTPEWGASFILCPWYAFICTFVAMNRKNLQDLTLKGMKRRQLRARPSSTSICWISPPTEKLTAVAFNGKTGEDARAPRSTLLVRTVRTKSVLWGAKYFARSLNLFCRYASKVT